MFDSTIRPILEYGSEVWSAEFLKLISKPNRVDKAYKYIAGMPIRASHFAIKAELGREPSLSFICSHAF